MSTVIKVENLSKRYRLGVVNRDMLYKDLQSRWAKFRGKEDPNAPIGLKHDKRLEHGDEFWALRNVDLEVKEGEILGIIGRNGAGKSTLLKILSQITAPTEGKIKVKGRIASLLEVGTGFHPELTGRENVYLNGAILGMTRKEVTSKFDEIVGFAEIDEFIDTPVKRYSSGMYVRLAFAVAAHLDPEILIVDEVLAVGDTEFQNKCIGKMESVAKGGRTIIFVSHQLYNIRRLCSSAILLEAGAVKSAGLPNTVADLYTNSTGSQFASATEITETMQGRSGSGRIKIKTFRCVQADGAEGYCPESGNSCSFTLMLDNTSKTSHHGVSLSVDIHDIEGNRLLLYNTQLLNCDFEVPPEGVSVTVKPSRLPLAPGVYKVSAYVGKANYETFDYIENIASLAVQEGDFYGTRHPGLASHCRILSDFQVEIGRPKTIMI
jgi:lipopolysaccharide transport system ATP-binding protein